MEFETFAAQLQILRIWVHNNKCKIPALVCHVRILESKSCFDLVLTH